MFKWATRCVFAFAEFVWWMDVTQNIWIILTEHTKHTCRCVAMPGQIIERIFACLVSLCLALDFFFHTYFNKAFVLFCLATFHLRTHTNACVSDEWKAENLWWIVILVILLKNARLFTCKPRIQASEPEKWLIVSLSMLPYFSRLFIYDTNVPNAFIILARSLRNVSFQLFFKTFLVSFLLSASFVFSADKFSHTKFYLRA